MKSNRRKASNTEKFNKNKSTRKITTWAERWEKKQQELKWIAMKNERERNREIQETCRDRRGVLEGGECSASESLKIDAGLSWLMKHREMKTLDFFSVFETLPSVTWILNPCLCSFPWKSNNEKLQRGKANFLGNFQICPWVFALFQLRA